MSNNQHQLILQAIDDMARETESLAELMELEKAREHMINAQAIFTYQLGKEMVSNEAV